MPSNPFIRSKLFVPGARLEFFDKALASAADAISFDLEDSVLPEAKAQARGNVAAALGAAAAAAGGPLLIVRVNAMDTPWFEDDLKAVVQRGLAWVNLPKVSSAADVRHAVAWLQTVEAAAGVYEPVRLLVNIETATALHHAHEIAAAHPRVAGLQLGLGDLFEPLGIARKDPVNVHAAMFAVRMAAGAAGVFAFDGAYPDLNDEAGLRAEAQMARRLGYAGKSCIHPKQIATCHEVFSPGAAERAQAERIVAAAQEAPGQGAFVVDGHMIDAPFLQRARALVEAAPAGRDRP